MVLDTALEALSGERKRIGVETPATPRKTEPDPTPRMAKTASHSPERSGHSEAWRDAALRLDQSNPVVLKLALSAEAFYRRMIDNNRDRGTWVWIYGPTGCGKTHVSKRLVSLFRGSAIDAYAAGKWRGGRIPCGEFIDWPTLHDSPYFADRLAELAEVDFVALDDVGSEVDKFRDGQSAERLRRVLNACERKWVWISSNLPRDILKTHYDARIASRFEQAFRLNLHGAPDYRKTLARRALSTDPGAATHSTTTLHA